MGRWRVASAEPPSTSAKPSTFQMVSRSLRNSTPPNTATAGFTYVTAVLRTGPISPMSAIIITKASAEHTTASTTIDVTTPPEGHAVGHDPRSATTGV